ncbi:MAG TPA: sugar isomerase [Verrucomicrobiae bacterium]
MKTMPHTCHCSCCHLNHNPQPALDALNRREFLFRVGAATAGGMMLSGLDVLAGDDSPGLPIRGPKPSQALRVQPVLTYDIAQRRPHTSWRNWGGLHTEEDVAAEKGRIEAELEKLKSKSDFGIEFLPLASVKSPEQAAAISRDKYDALIVYAAGGGGNLLEALISPAKWNLMFLRHDPGPVYLWYEIVHPRFLRKTVDEYAPTGLDVHDVVVDEVNELGWRLRALHGLKNTLGKRILCIGGAGGWGAGGQKAPEISRTLWKLDLVDLPYKDLEPRLKAARGNASLVKACGAAASRYLKGGKISLHTTREFVNNAFVLTEVMKDIMDDAKTDALTIQHCMGTIMGMSETTACLPLSMLNDAGYLAFCESDFVVIPSGILLHYISGKPVFLNDPTFPHQDVVTLAHCTAPRKMDGKKAEKTKLLTHFESDYGAAPKVEMRIGQVCTNLVPDFDCKKWVGFEGTIVGNPFLDICRSQVDVKVKGDCNALLEEMKGFHWMMSYGNYMRETGYALRKLGVGFHDVSAPTKA